MLRLRGEFEVRKGVCYKIENVGWNVFVPLIHVGLIVTASAAISFSRLVGYYCDEYIRELGELVTMVKWRT